MDMGNVRYVQFIYVKADRTDTNTDKDPAFDFIFHGIITISHHPAFQSKSR